MADIAVVAHTRKSFGGGLPDLRRIMALEGVTVPLWYEVRNSEFLAVRGAKYFR